MGRVATLVLLSSRHVVAGLKWRTMDGMCVFARCSRVRIALIVVAVGVRVATCGGMVGALDCA
jgi:hypothetical protein